MPTDNRLRVTSLVRALIDATLMTAEWIRCHLPVAGWWGDTVPYAAVIDGTDGVIRRITIVVEFEEATGRLTPTLAPERSRG